MPLRLNRKDRSGRENAAAVSQQNNPSHSKNAATSKNNFDEQVEYLIPAQVRMISGCHSLETSADVSNIHSIAGKGKLPSPEGRAGGACTTALLSILYDAQKRKNDNHYSGDGSTTFQQLLLELRRRLAQTGMSQVSQLTSSRPLELEETPFSLRSIPATNQQQQQQQQHNATATATATTTTTGIASRCRGTIGGGSLPVRFFVACRWIIEARCPAGSFLGVSIVLSKTSLR
mmetsp:Transcript_23298/g.50946  ORF Transcript_23298/g.50946 Transcript_23298/m.50946 type:complete len:232 (+) Transcript_23298:244-939(+)